MIRFALALAAVATALPAAAQAPADAGVYFGQFDRFCLATGGDPARAVAAAEAEGWIAAPQAMVDEAVNPAAPEVAIRLSGSADAAPARLLISASPPMADRNGLKVRACAIEPAPGVSLDEYRLTALVEARLGFTGAMLPVWVFSGAGPFVNESELILEGQEAMAARAAVTPVYMLNLMPSGTGGSALGLLRMGD
jgi:hypothetical protein